MSDAHISCREVVELVTEYLDCGLTPHEASLFEEHLNFCEGCVYYVEQMRQAVAVSERVQESDVPPEVLDRLMTAFRDWRGGS